VLILGYTDPSDYGTLIENQVRPAIYDYHGAELLSAESVAKGKVSPIHIKLDTGMSRIGFQCTEESLDIIEKINSLPGINIEGIFTHYAKADELDKSAAKSQLQKFRDMCSGLKERGIDIPLKHISNSAGIMEMDNEGFDMVRCGIVTYGLYPSEEVDKARAPLKPAMSLMSRIIHVKQLEKGRGIGYGWSYVTDHDMKVATVSAGYADGYPRAQSNLGRVIIHGKYAPIIGRVCMDQFMVDVSDIDEVNVGDYVTLVGREGDLQITVEEVAEPANSFNYELVCNVSRRVPRVYIKDGVRVSERNYLES
jgi:alanine racemase